ncbi:MAG TPA: VOC family protein [Solirubrobacteraceae bacterium]|nr:VOC family protein [Solirubrobacteraceae bacterium]
MSDSPPRGRLGWVIVYVPDVAAAIDFHQRAFGLGARFVAEDQSYGELDTGATTLAFASETLGDSHYDGGFRRASTREQPCNVEICLVFDDVGAAFQQALSAGAIELAAPAEKPWGQTVAYVRDPFGTLIELASPLS